MMQHKGYSGEFVVDLDAEVIRGRVIGTRDVITFQGRTVAEARAAFVDSVDDYLDFCAERGESPEKPFSGRVLLRLPAEVHRTLAIHAERAGLSLNSLIVDQLKLVASSEEESGSVSRYIPPRVVHPETNATPKPRSGVPLDSHAG